MIIEFLVKKVLLVNLTKNRLGCQMITMSETGPEIKFNCQSNLIAFLDRKYIVALKKIVIQIKVVAY